ncbi:CoA-transferase [Janibacter alittae]|uniref:CoA-transferase n=1 Tax=Janibacter alittae TaxID=3115209 RepID=UPI003BAF1FCF
MTPTALPGRPGIVQRVARDLGPGSYVNLGVGIPVDVLPLLRHRPDIFVHSENGVLGMRTLDPDEATDDNMVNAGKMPVGAHEGAAFFHHADSFAMMRGGHLDACVLGAYQASASGDLANWSLGRPDAANTVGGAMDLVVGAKQVWVTMEHLTHQGKPRILPECTLPLTGVGVVNRVYTDKATLHIVDGTVIVAELVGDTTFDELVDITPVPLIDRPVEREQGQALHPRQVG